MDINEQPINKTELKNEYYEFIGPINENNTVRAAGLLKDYRDVQQEELHRIIASKERELNLLKKQSLATKRRLID
jgi:hypothetical protein